MCNLPAQLLTMKIPLATSLVMLSFTICFNSYAQSCNCNQEFIQVVNKIEKSYAGFNDKVNSKTKASYDQHTKSALDQSKRVSKPAYCLSLINNWLTFFKDGHLQIGRDRISKDKEKVALQKRIDSAEFLKLSEKEIETLRRSKGLIGIYLNEDSTSEIAVVKNKNDFRDYAGIVISAKTGNWLPGQVILELKHGKDTLDGILYDRYHIPNNVSLPAKTNGLGNWQRVGTQRTVITDQIGKALVSSKLLSEKTLYLKISTFNQSNAKNIDSLFKVNKALLNKTPNLILDLRNNGGGADFSYNPIVPYLYTNPYKSIGADLLATDDNINGWLALTRTEGLPADQITSIHKVVEKMKAHQGELFNFNEDQTQSLDGISSYPKKVIILINENCGSTTEEFLFLAKQSTKVTLMGNRTAGVLDYANMRGAEFSCMPYMLFWATTRSRRIDIGLGIDNVGIQPAVFLAKDDDWIAKAKRYAEGAF